MAFNLSQNFKNSDDLCYVDIHGCDVRVVVCEKTGLIYVPLDELNNLGFSIYHKSQYNKLLVDDSQFVHAFNLFMLQSAQTYMLKHKFAFKENEVLESINKCKQILTEGHSSETKKEITSPQFFKNHTVELSQDANLNITSTLREPFTNPAIPNTSITTNLRDPFTSPLSKVGGRSPSFENKTQNKSRSFEQKGSFESKSQRNSRGFDNSFDNKNQKNSRPDHRSFENNRRQRSSRSSDQHSVTSDYSDENVKKNDSSDLKIPSNADSLNQNGRISNEGNFKNQQKREDSVDEERKIVSVELTKPEHDVIVTHIEKLNVYWVQDLGNADTLVKIDKKIKEQVDKQKVVTRSTFNNVYLAPDEGSWYRCKPIKFKPLTVFFIDYGNTAQVTVSDLREASEDLASIPAQAVRVTFEESPDVQAFETVRIRISKRFDKGTYRVVLVGKNDVAPEAAKVKEETVTPTKKATPSYFDRPKPLCSLENGQRVMVIGEKEGKLFLRTKECYDKLKKIEQAIEEADGPMEGTVKKGQLVLCNYNKKLYRGQVVAVATNSVQIEFLDYGETVDVQLTALKNITEMLSQEPITYIMSPPVHGVEELNEEAKEIIQEMIENRTKATVVLNSSGFDLHTATGELSVKLKSTQTPGHITLKDLKFYKPPLGEGLYFLYSFKDSDDFTFVGTEDLETYMEDVVKSELDDTKPHFPLVGEVCYGYFQGNWSRCEIIRVLQNRFEVRFIDFGNLEFLKCDQLRKASDCFKKTPVLGVRGRFVGLPPLKNFDQLLKGLIEDGEIYELDVKKFDHATNTYEVESPELYKKMRESN